jgi:hypothetical protein
MEAKEFLKTLPDYKLYLPKADWETVYRYMEAYRAAKFEKEERHFHLIVQDKDLRGAITTTSDVCVHIKQSEITLSDLQQQIPRRRDNGIYRTILCYTEFPTKEDLYKFLGKEKI